MKLLKAHIKNFRLLQDAEINFDEKCTSIVGKNNTGKTSLTAIFKLLLGRSSSIPFDDISLGCHDGFKNLYDKYLKINEETKEEVIQDIQRNIPKIQLILTIQYSEKDNWNLIKPFLISLDETNQIKILCEYSPESSEKFYKELIKIVNSNKNDGTDIIESIRLIFENHYKLKIRPYSESIDSNANKLELSDLKNLINICFINAQRTLDDSNIESKSKLSKIFHDQFNKNGENEDTNKEELLKEIKNSSSSIDKELKTFFSPFVNFFKTFGFPTSGSEEVELKSELNPDNLFRNNIKLYYNNNGSILPEKYNGLGYSNLIFILSQIIGFLEVVKGNEGCLNLIFIEEPEAHMHPQMQIVFTKNINAFLDKMALSAQVIITTHSSHILASSKFPSIRYFNKVNSVSSNVKDLMDFSISLTQPEKLQFLEQYLTLGKCDLFFSDKAILFEGTVERLLMPVFMEKVDAGNKNKLLEQYITSVEIGGAYMHMFKELLGFLNLKTLIVTDIDSVEEDSGKKCAVKIGEKQVTSNAAIIKWIPCEEKIDKLLSMSSKKEDGNVRIAYQCINEYHKKCGRSFEEAFILDNTNYIFQNKDDFISIKNHLKKYSDITSIALNSFMILEYIDNNRKKTDFAFDLLSVNKEQWEVPNYIKEGLEWLAQ